MKRYYNLGLFFPASYDMHTWHILAYRYIYNLNTKCSYVYITICTSALSIAEAVIPADRSAKSRTVIINFIFLGLFPNVQGYTVLKS